MIEKVRKIVTEEKDEIRRQYKAKVKGIFGSHVRGEAHADSDVDLLVDFDEGVNLFDMIGLEQFLEDKLGCKVDVVPRSALRKELRPSVYSEMIDFETSPTDFAKCRSRLRLQRHKKFMRDYRLYLKDILTAMIAAQGFVERMDFDAFAADDKTVSAVVRKLEIIGEATKNVSETIRQTYPQVPWRQMAGMRDRLIHGYYDVNYSVVWEVVTELIPPLQPVIKQILEDMEAEAAHE